MKTGTQKGNHEKHVAEKEVRWLHLTGGTICQDNLLKAIGHEARESKKPTAPARDSTKPHCP